MKTSELTGAALDWAVAKCEGLMQGQIAIDGVTHGWLVHGFYKPSTDWAQGGPIIERENISLRFYLFEFDDGLPLWWAFKSRVNDFIVEGCGDAPLIAAMRCYVASKLGDEIELPEGLA